MGQYWLRALPRYLDKWGVRYRLHPGWKERSRSSGGFDEIRGIGIHHTADDFASADGILGWEVENAPARPIGNATIHRDGLLTVTAAGATNTQGRGVALHTSRGVVPTDSANRFLWSLEAQNKGDGSERWPDAMTKAYPLICAAVIDCINNETPGANLGPRDIFAHFETAPGRKNDPAGPSPWAEGPDRWDMDHFRGDVRKLLNNPPGSNDEEDDMGTEPELHRYRGDPGRKLFYWDGGSSGKYVVMGDSATGLYKEKLRDSGYSDDVRVRSMGMARATGRVVNNPNLNPIHWVRYNRFGQRRSFLRKKED